MNEKLEAIQRLIEILERLRVECPWDRKQTTESLRNNTIEECFELSDAILQNNPMGIKEELGDLLLHILFYSKIGEEENNFTLTDVANTISEKLIYRHPHIFGDVVAEDEYEVKKNWEELKLKEKGGKRTVLGGVPRGMPSLQKALRIGEKVASVGFDWEQPIDVWNKVKEEIAEVEAEVKNGNSKGMEEEFGDVLFALTNAARLYGIDPDAALEKTNQKFIRRFNYLESQTISKGKHLTDMTLEEMDVYWEEAKKQE